MKLIRKLRSALRLRPADVPLVAEAALMLGIARICVLFVPFRVLAKWLSHAPDAAQFDAARGKRIGWAVQMASRNVPWNAVCLPQAIAAKAMLALRGQGSAFHLGAMIEADGSLSAHAWLESGGRIVTGASGMKGMSHLTRFG